MGYKIKYYIVASVCMSISQFVCCSHPLYSPQPPPVPSVEEEPLRPVSAPHTAPIRYSAHTPQIVMLVTIPTHSNLTNSTN